MLHILKLGFEVHNLQQKFMPQIQKIVLDSWLCSVSWMASLSNYHSWSPCTAFFGVNLLENNMTHSWNALKLLIFGLTLKFDYKLQPTKSPTVYELGKGSVQIHASKIEHMWKRKLSRQFLMRIVFLKVILTEPV